MGVYPHHSIVGHQRLFDGSEIWTERKSEPGVVRERKVAASPWELVQRTDCFCCSCPDYGNDYACRNHGYYARRPCDVHAMPGTPDDSGTMPASVQDELKRQRDLEPK